MSQTKLTPQAKQRIAELISAIHEAKSDREAVRRGFAEHLELLKLPAREIIFHPNFIDGCKTRRASRPPLARMPGSWTGTSRFAGSGV